jgi:hypothetical protein
MTTANRLTATPEQLKAIPEAPPCTSWCEGHPNADHGRWDDVHRYSTGGVDADTYCRRRIPVGAGIEIAVERFTDWNSGEGTIEIADVAIRLDDALKEAVSPEVALQLATALTEAAAVARQVAR